MTDRNLTTTREQVFGDVECGTECRICGRPVDDGRAKTCSDYCGNLLSAVMGMLNWTSVRRRIIERDEKTCQVCGFDYALEQRARGHIRDRIEALAGDRPEHPPASEPDHIENYDWDDYHNRLDDWRDRREKLKARYGDPHDRARELEVDHIQPIADGGHPFDPANLQTLCEVCHKTKTADENSERGRTPSREDLNESLFDYVRETTGEATQ